MFSLEKKCFLIGQTISGVLKAPRSFTHKPRLRILHQIIREEVSGATDPQGPAVLCLFPEEGSPLFLLLYSGCYFLLTRRLWRWMGRFPRDGDLERGQHYVRGREWVSGWGSEDWQEPWGASRLCDVRQVTSLWALELPNSVHLWSRKSFGDTCPWAHRGPRSNSAQRQKSFPPSLPETKMKGQGRFGSSGGKWPPQEPGESRSAFSKVEAATCPLRQHLTLTLEVGSELGWGYRPSVRERPSPSPLWPQFLLLGNEDTGSLGVFPG